MRPRYTLFGKFFLLLCFLGFILVSCRDQALAQNPNEVIPPVEELPAETPVSQVIDDDYKAVIYYLDDETSQLAPVVRDLLPTRSDSNRIKQVIEWLSMDPEEEGISKIWPDTILLRDVYVVDGESVVVDFKGQSLESYDVGVNLEGMLIYSLVDSVLETFPWYKQVWILVDGRVAETLLGHVDTEKPLTKNHSLVRPEMEEDKEPAQEPAPNQEKPE